MNTPKRADVILKGIPLSPGLAEGRTRGKRCRRGSEHYLFSINKSLPEEA